MEYMELLGVIVNKQVKTIYIALALLVATHGIAAPEQRTHGVFASVRTAACAVGTFCKSKAALFNPLYTNQLVKTFGLATAAKWGIPTFLGGLALAHQGKPRIGGLSTRTTFDKVHNSFLAASYPLALPIITAQLSKYQAVHNIMVRPTMQRILTSKPWRLACGPMGQWAWGLACALEWSRIVYKSIPLIKRGIKNYEITPESIQETLATAI